MKREYVIMCAEKENERGKEMMLHALSFGECLGVTDKGRILLCIHLLDSYVIKMSDGYLFDNSDGALGTDGFALLGCYWSGEEKKSFARWQMDVVDNQGRADSSELREMIEDVEAYGCGSISGFLFRSIAARASRRWSWHAPAFPRKP